MKLKIKKLHHDAIIPKYATPGAAAFDLHALETYVIDAEETRLIKTGISLEIPEGYELQIRPRSGISLKTPLRVSNSPGTVDSDYRGEICIILTNMNVNRGTSTEFIVNKGDRIAQAVLCPVIQAEFEEVADLSESERGSGGFGSTGA